MVRAGGTYMNYMNYITVGILAVMMTACNTNRNKSRQESVKAIVKAGTPLTVALWRPPKSDVVVDARCIARIPDGQEEITWPTRGDGWCYVADMKVALQPLAPLDCWASYTDRKTKRAIYSVYFKSRRSEYGPVCTSSDAEFRLQSVTSPEEFKGAVLLMVGLDLSKLPPKDSWK